MQWTDRLSAEIEEDLKNIEAGVEGIRMGLRMRSTTQIKMAAGFVKHWADMVKSDMKEFGHE